MGEGLFLQRLRPTSNGPLSEGWATHNYLNVDDNVDDPTVSGTGTYDEALESASDDELWVAYNVTDPTLKMWWYHIAKIDIHVLSTSSGAISTSPKVNVSWVIGNTRQGGWLPITSPAHKSLSVNTAGSFTWTSATFYPEETARIVPTEWYWDEWTRDIANYLCVEIKSPKWSSAGTYYRVAVVYADLYVFPSSGGAGG